MAAVGEARPAGRQLGRYELIASIGSGGMAEVHLARQRGPMGFEKLVVVKTVHEHLAAHRDFIEMLLDEARIAGLVKHANVVDIYDLGEADGSYFIAMEYLEGEPLLGVLRAGKQGKRLDPLSTARLIADCAEGLHAAHELRAMSGQPLSVVHHDVSPGNVMVLYSGEVKLVDFGVAKAENLAGVALGEAGGRVLMKGKMSYMAPEKLRGAPGDRRSDVFSLGVVLWESLTLRRLFRADSEKEVARMIVEGTVPAPSTVDPSAPAELDAIVAKALAKDPNERYQTAKAMAAALEEVLRKKGYSGKNDKIGQYMHATFGDRLAARRELIRSLATSAVTPSAQAIAHAFQTENSLGGREDTPARRARQTPPQGVKVGLPPPRPALKATFKTASASSGPVASGQISADAPTIVDGRAIPPGPAVAPAVRPSTEDLSTFTEVDALPAEESSAIRQWVEDDKLTVLDQRAYRDPPRPVGQPEVAPPTGRRNAVVIGALVALALVVVVLGFVMSRGSDDTTVSTATNAAAAPGEDEIVMEPEPTAPSPPAAHAGSAVVIGDLGGPDGPSERRPPKKEIARPPDKKADKRPDKADKPPDKADKPPDKPDKPPDKADKADKAAKADKPPDKADKPPEKTQVAAVEPPKPAATPDALYREGMRHFVAGKLRDSISSFEQARSRSPGYAPAYRGIGMAKQQLGDKGGARAAFQKYLKLAPDAPDAGAIKTRLEKL